MPDVRQPAVAGRFYPGRADVLTRDINSYLAPPAEKLSALGCVVPHAGYMYSGHVAGAVYSRLELPRRFLILGPNHTGAGDPLAIMTDGVWQTPLGAARIDTVLAEALMNAFRYLTEDDIAHRAEHSLEVQVPFLQALVGEFCFVPICVGTGNLEVLTALGQAIAKVLDEEEEPVLLVASSDMNHYETDSITRVKDRKAIDKVLALDPRGLHRVIHEENISMCGYAPTIAMLTAAKLLGATKAELIKYATSADVSGDREMVVGYAGIAIF
jgi:MEMO1 family protein